MLNRRPLEILLYATLVALCLAALALVLISPPAILNSRVVYQGF